MPLSEFLRLAMEKLEASKKKSCSTDHSISGTENNLVEVVWEDSPTHHSLSPTTPSVRDATLGNSTTECVGGVDSMLDDISPVVASGEFDLSQNYVVDDGVQDYFSEISGVKAKDASGIKRSSCDEAVKYLDNNQDAFKFSSCKARSLSSWPPQHGQTSRLSGISMFRNGFSKDAAVVKANIPISGGISSPGVKRMKVKETDPACRCSNPAKSILLTQNTVLDGDGSVEPVFASSSVGSGINGDRVTYETHNLKRKLCDIESECHSDLSCNAKQAPCGLSFLLVIHICLICGQDIQIESIGVEKLTAARGDTGGARKSRTAQVHNIAERRRRDRINEKMRALQQLIPNCNKADKASMLDDAIQYLKNLQHQVQTMSMGAGLCIPPMMFAPGSQHVYPAPMPHYSSMGVGMGMGMSYPIFPVHANFQGTPFTGAHHTPLRIPTASLNLNFDDPMKSNSQNAEASTSMNRGNNQ